MGLHFSDQKPFFHAVSLGQSLQRQGDYDQFVMWWRANVESACFNKMSAGLNMWAVLNVIRARCSTGGATDVALYLRLTLFDIGSVLRGPWPLVRHSTSYILHPAAEAPSCRWTSILDPANCEL